MLFISLFLSFGLLASTNPAATPGNRARHGLAHLLSGLALYFGFFCLQAIPLALNAFLICLAALFCLPFDQRPFLFLKSSLVVTVISYAILSTAAVVDVREWVKLRERYPYESLENRLVYAKKGNHLSPRDGQGALKGSQGGEPLFKSLEEMEVKIDVASQEFMTMRRIRSLQHLHASYVKLFIDSDGFGAMRMVTRPTRYALELLHDPAPIPLPDRKSDLKDDLPDRIIRSPGVYTNSGTTFPDQKMFLQMHHENLVDFVNLGGFGYFKDLRHVAGFESHRFQELTPFKTPNHWKLQRLELVSLLKHENPAVYISEYLPRMKEMGQAETRPLDAFETSALDALLSGEDLKVLQNENYIRMVGSIRAAKQCLSCHEVERGFLLGAFTYQLLPAK